MFSSSQSNGLHFFKIIQKRNLRDGELKVPTSFAKMHWEGMSNPVSLRLPNKTEWKVSWKKREGDIWLCNGLKEFAKDLSLSEFQFVVFQYQDNSCFNVIVFAKNGSEINYSIKETREERDEVEESDCSVIILDKSPSLQAKRPKSLPQSSQPHKKRKTNPRDQKESKLRKLQSSQHHHKKKKKTTNGKKKVEAHSGFDNAANKHLNSGSSEERIKDFHEVVKKDFYSEKDFFTCTMYKTYVNSDQMMLPNQFYNLHLVEMDGRSVTLFYVGKNKTWNVRLKKLQNGQIRFTSGWIKFARDNSLKIGDVCAFVLTKTKGISFQVFHFAFGKEIRSPLFEVNNSDREELLHRPSSSEKEFIIYIKGPSHQLNIPKKYIKNFISESEKIATLIVGGNSWPVKVLLYKSYSEAKLSQGWSKFFQDCQLKQGDCCYFKLVNEEKLAFEVTIN